MLSGKYHGKIGIVIALVLNSQGCVQMKLSSSPHAAFNLFLLLQRSCRTILTPEMVCEMRCFEGIAVLR